MVEITAEMTGRGDDDVVEDLETKLGMDDGIAVCVLYVVAMLLIFGGLMAMAGAMHAL